MCGNGDNGLGIIAGLIAAAAMLLAAFADKHSGAHAASAPQHAISAGATHVAIELRPVTLDIDLAHASASLEVRL
jgi:hypothetical protein